jgi:hypothetical protein
MQNKPRQFLGLFLIASLMGLAWWTPWSSLASRVGSFLNSEEDDRPPWLTADGHKYSKSAYPELYTVIGNRFGGDKTTFALPDMSEDHDYLANDRFGSRLVYRCIAVRRLEDNSPAGTLAWCDHQGNR